MKRLLRIVARWASLFFGILLFSGCNDLIIESSEVRFFLNEDFSGRVVVTYYGMESESSTPEGQRGDFSDIIDVWSYEDWSADPEDAYTDTQLWVEDGKLHGSYTQYFKDIRALDDYDFSVVIDDEGIHLVLDEDTMVKTEGLVTEAADTVRTELDIDEATGDSVWTEIEPKIYPYLKVSWPSGTRELACTVFTGEEDPYLPTTAFADTFETFLGNLSPFDKRVREFYGHASRFFIFEWLGDQDLMEREREAICVALSRVLSAPEPDPEKVLDIAWGVNEPGLFAETQCVEERLRAARLVVSLMPDDLWHRGLLAQALNRSGQPEEAVSEIVRVLAIPAPADSLEAVEHARIHDWMQELQGEIVEGNR